MANELLGQARERPGPLWTSRPPTPDSWRVAPAGDFPTAPTPLRRVRFSSKPPLPQTGRPHMDSPDKPGNDVDMSRSPRRGLGRFRRVAEHVAAGFLVELGLE